MIQGTGQHIFIKRYSNKKLYTASTSRYVTIEDISQLVKKGNNVKIINHDGRDLTQYYLSEIVKISELKRKPIISSKVLHDIIKVGGIQTYIANQKGDK